ncbi:phage tail assembly chaperone [Duganella sp.]|uniref:phage tail assembly chaperone n=1 Tax=Duganella sp. TaxID=1904440 RepID=UPI0031DF85C3
MTIKLGKNPKDFKKTLTVVSIDGVSDTLSITYIYRDPVQMAELLDKRAAAAAAEAEASAKAALEAEAAEAAATEQGRDAAAAPVKIPSIKEGYLAQAHAAANEVLEIATGWDVDDAFTAENLLVLEKEFPGALVAIQARYQQAVTEVRVKN